MGKVFPELDAPLRAWIAAQHVFFVATAPHGDDGHINCSPKGLDTFRVLGPTTVAYLDYIGSGVETIAHVHENGRIHSRAMRSGDGCTVQASRSSYRNPWEAEMAGTHVALLRGINVGRAKRVAMSDLKALVECLGYRDVRTLLNSGNVVFSTGVAPHTAAARIEKALAAKTGVNARVTVFTAAEIATVVDENPLLEVADHPSRLLITFLRDAEDRSRLVPLTRQEWDSDVLAIGTRVVYVWCASGILESRLAEAVSKLLGDAGTARNWATVLKLHALTSESN